MRGMFITLAILILTSQIALADYQYTQSIVELQNITRYYSENGRQLPEDLKGQFLTVELGTWKESLGTIMNYRIRVTNKISEPVSATIHYLINGKTVSQQVGIDPFGYELIEGTYAQESGPPDISNLQITYHNILSKNEVNKIQLETCKKCSGECCLNDNAPCKFDSQCGSGICNIAGYCGHSKIVECLQGTRNCNNQSCLPQSTKEIGDGYNCVWECKSDYGLDNKCRKKPIEAIKENIWFWSVVFLIITVGIFFTIRTIRIHTLDQKIRERSKAVYRLEQSIIMHEDDARQEHRKIKDAKQRLQNDIKDILEVYQKRFGHKFILHNGYIRFAKSKFNSGPGQFFHIWWFEKNHKRKVKFGYEIHHKDGNKWNNDISNLEELSKEEHRRRHGY